MKHFEIKYRYKTHNRIYSIMVKAVCEEDAKRIAYNKIDNRIFVLI